MIGDSDGARDGDGEAAEAEEVNERETLGEDWASAKLCKPEEEEGELGIRSAAPDPLRERDAAGKPKELRLGDSNGERVGSVMLGFKGMERTRSAWDRDHAHDWTCGSPSYRCAKGNCRPLRLSLHRRTQARMYRLLMVWSLSCMALKSMSSRTGCTVCGGRERRNL